jgi:lactoylglutathione lyase
MKYLHTMVRVSNLDRSLEFYCQALGLIEVSRKESEAGRFTLVFLASSADSESADFDSTPMIELTYNWDTEVYTGGRNFGHLAYSVENIYDTCERLMANGVIINRPPRDGRMAFVRSPDNISIELLQQGDPLPVLDPWASMGNVGEW